MSSPSSLSTPGRLLHRLPRHRFARYHGVVAVLAALLGSSSDSLGAAASPLADATEASDHSTALALLRQGGDVNRPQADGTSALHWAAHQNDVTLVGELLKAGALVDSTNRYGVTPLSLACINGSPEIVGLLLQAGADPNSTLRGGESALMTAARTGRPEPVAALLARGARIDACDARGQTALFWAAADGHARVVELLIAAGADFRSPMPDSGFTPLLVAARDGHLEVIRTLLKAGADLHETIRPRKGIAKAPRAGMSALAFAVENGHFELALALVDAGADPNDQRSGFAPLHILSWVRKPNRGDGEDGDPPPIGSGSLSSLQFARQLVERGAKVDARLESGRTGKSVLTRKGATPFLMASLTADVPYMRLLLDLGADPSIPNAEGSTALMAAAGLGNQAPTEEAGTESEVLEAVDLLLARGAVLNAVDVNGETAMHGAAYKNLPQVVRHLAAKGADTAVWNQTNRWGWTPLRIAEGHRVGNFKPSPETVAALHEVMRAAGITPPVTAPPASPAPTSDYPQDIRGKPTPP